VRSNCRMDVSSAAHNCELRPTLNSGLKNSDRHNYQTCQISVARNGVDAELYRAADLSMTLMRRSVRKGEVCSLVFTILFPRGWRQKDESARVRYNFTPASLA